jgi:hypothetical protein
LSGEILGYEREDVGDTIKIAKEVISAVSRTLEGKD